MGEKTGVLFQSAVSAMLWAGSLLRTLSSIFIVLWGPETQTPGHKCQVFKGYLLCRLHVLPEFWWVMGCFGSGHSCRRVLNYITSAGKLWWGGALAESPAGFGGVSLYRECMEYRGETSNTSKVKRECKK